MDYKKNYKCWYAGASPIGIALVASLYSTSTLASVDNGLQAATVFSDANFGGGSLSITEGEVSKTDLRRSQVGNNAISSIRIEPGFQVVACKGKNLRGSCVTITESVSDLGGFGFDNVISSLNVQTVKSPEVSACQASAGLGMATVESNDDFDTTENALQDAITNQGFSIEFNLDHSANAASVGITIPPNTVFLARDTSQATTPQLQSNGAVALDLPQKLLVWQIEDAVCVGYTTSSYVDARFSVGVDSTISDALATIATTAANNSVIVQPSELPDRRDTGVLSVQSANDFATTRTRLEAAIAARPLNIARQIDLQEETRVAGSDAIPPNLLTIFGNPNIGNLFIELSPTFGADLPLKLVIREDAYGNVFIEANDIRFLADRHGLDRNNPTIETVFGVIKGILFEVAATP